jgi:hypothetical protein
MRSQLTTNLYDNQDLGWEISHNGSVLRVHVHGSICGGFGPDPCVTEINLENSGQLMIELPKEDLEALRACDGAMGTDSILDEGEAESSTCQRSR